jgi:hypothetical protein
MMSKRLYLVMAVQEWEKFTLNLNFGVPFIGDGKSWGYAPVYESKEKAQADYPDRAIITVESIQEEESK